MVYQVYSILYIIYMLLINMYNKTLSKTTIKFNITSNLWIYIQSFTSFL